MSDTGLLVRPLEEAERPWLSGWLERSWGSTTVVSRGTVHDASRLPGVVCESGDQRVGVATYAVGAGECELATIDAFEEGRGIGSALLAAVVAEARRHGCRRLWLITTNDNLRALGFYQRRGMRLVAVHAGAIAESRRLKPSIPLIGDNGIPLRDELELELELG